MAAAPRLAGRSPCVCDRARCAVYEVRVREDRRARVRKRVSTSQCTCTCCGTRAGTTTPIEVRTLGHCSSGSGTGRSSTQCAVFGVECRAVQGLVSDRCVRHRNPGWVVTGLMPETARRGASAPGDDASTVMFVGFINVATSCVTGDLVRGIAGLLWPLIALSPRED